MWRDLAIGNNSVGDDVNQIMTSYHDNDMINGISEAALRTEARRRAGKYPAGEAFGGARVVRGGRYFRHALGS